MLAELPPECLDTLLWFLSARGLAALECTSRLFARRLDPGFAFVACGDGPRRCEEAARRQVGEASPPVLRDSIGADACRSWKQQLQYLEAAVALRRGLSIAAAAQHAALCSAGSMRLFTAGVGLALRDGRLGHGDAAEPSEVPRAVEALSEQRVVAVSASSSHTVALTRSGQLFSCGVGDDGQLGHGDQHGKYVPRLCRALEALVVAQVSAGSRHTCAVTDRGHLFTWGAGSFGRLGHGNEEPEFSPRRVAALESTRVAFAAAGDNHSAAVTDAGCLYTFGRGGYGRLGHGDEGRGYMEPLPTAVELENEHVMHVAIGAYHTVAVTAAGEVWCFGRGEHGRLGTGFSDDALYPARVTGGLAGDRAVSAAAGGAHTVVVTANGGVFACGHHGANGISADRDVFELEPVALPEAAGGATQASASWAYTMVSTRDGSVYEFGAQRYGDAAKALPTRVRGAPKVQLPAEVAARVWRANADDGDGAAAEEDRSYVPAPEAGYQPFVDEDYASVLGEWTAPAPEGQPESGGDPPAVVVADAAWWPMRPTNPECDE